MGLINTEIISLSVERFQVIPVQLCAHAVTISSSTAANNGGSTVVSPAAISRDRVPTRNSSYIQVRLLYPAAGTIATDVVVQLFGVDRPQDDQDASNVNWERLYTPGGAHELTLADSADDVTYSLSGTSFKATDWATVSTNGCSEVLCAIKTALAGSDLTGALIQAKVY